MKKSYQVVLRQIFPMPKQWFYIFDVEQPIQPLKEASIQEASSAFVSAPKPQPSTQDDEQTYGNVAHHFIAMNQLKQVIADMEADEGFLGKEFLVNQQLL